MALTSEQAYAQYRDNCDYDIPLSVSKTRLFIQACRVILSYMVQSSSTGTSSISDDYHKISEQADRAESVLAANDEDAATSAGSGFVRHADISEFRD